MYARGWGYSTNSYTGRHCPESKPLPFYIQFLKQKATLSYTIHRKWYSLHIYTYKTLHPFSISFATIIEDYNNQVNFTKLFTLVTWTSQLFRWLSARDILKWQFFSTCENPTLLFTSSLKKDPFGVEPSYIVHYYREYPHPWVSMSVSWMWCMSWNYVSFVMEVFIGGLTRSSQACDWLTGWLRTFELYEYPKSSGQPANSVFTPLSPHPWRPRGS